MRAIWLILFLHVGWATCQCSMLVVSMHMLDARSNTLQRIPPELCFAPSERDYAFGAVSDAKIRVVVQASEKVPEPVSIEIHLPSEWFASPSTRIEIATGAEAGFVELPLAKLPEPGMKEKVQIQFGEVRGVGVVRRGDEYVAHVRNLRRPKAELTTGEPNEPIALVEPLRSEIGPAARASISLKVTPPRSARVAFKTGGDAQLGVDYQLLGDHVSSANGRSFVQIPAAGTTSLQIAALHNSKLMNRVPQSFEVAFLPDADDPDLTVKATPLAGQIANSDRVRLKLLASDDLNLYESNVDKEVVLRFEPLVEIQDAIDVAVVSKGSPGLVDGDYSLNWDPASKLSGLAPIALRVRAVDDQSPEKAETLTLSFPDNPNYDIEGPRELSLRIHDDDRKLVAGLESIELTEGNGTSLELTFDPPDDAKAQVDIRLAQGNAARFSILGANGETVSPQRDPKGLPKYSLSAPGKYTISAQDVHDNDLIDAAENLTFEFVPAAIPQFRLPASPLALKILDDDTAGNVLLVMACTTYVHEQAEPGRPIAPTFLRRFERIRVLADGERLVGQGVFFVGKSDDENPRYLLWKGARDQLGRFAADHSLMSRDGTPDCLIDCLDNVDKFVKHYRRRCQAPDDLQVIVIWPSVEDPQFEACRANRMPTAWTPTGKSRFIWLGSDAGRLGLVFLGTPPIEAFYDTFPRSHATLGEIPHSSDQTLAAKILEMKQQSQEP